MAIASNSRYISNTVRTLEVNNVSRQVIVMSEPSAATFQYVAHVLSADETIENLAYTYLGDPTLWWQIGNANPEILDWAAAVPGTTIRIPVGSVTSIP